MNDRDEGVAEMVPAPGTQTTTSKDIDLVSRRTGHFTLDANSQLRSGCARMGTRS
jgi:hypothetical protein